jgi:hypothetical protein
VLAPVDRSPPAPTAVIHCVALILPLGTIRAAQQFGGFLVHNEAQKFCQTLHALRIELSTPTLSRRHW